MSGCLMSTRTGRRRKEVQGNLGVITSMMVHKSERGVGPLRFDARPAFLHDQAIQQSSQPAARLFVNRTFFSRSI